MKIIIKLLFITLLFSACGKDNKKYNPDQRYQDPRKPLAWGDQKKIYGFAGDKAWKYSQNFLSKSLERYQFTTTNEQFFEFVREKHEKLDVYYKYKNLVFLCNLKGKDKISQYVKGILSPKTKEIIKKDSARIIVKRDLFANNQIIVFAVGNNLENLLKYLYIKREKIFEEFKSELFQRIKRQIYKIDTIPQSSFSHLPWEMKIPKNYVVFRQDPENNFISFLKRLRETPDRYIAVYYEKMDKNKIGKEWLIKKRRRIFKRYYEGDDFKKEDIRQEVVNFADRKAFKISGRWQNEQYIVGGAFQAFAFYDQKRKLAFIVDNSVYYPEGDKIEALIETEIISRTIKLKEIKRSSK